MDYIITVDTNGVAKGRETDSPTTDVAVVTADDINSPITGTSEAEGGDDVSYRILVDRIADNPELTVRQAAAAFGMGGMFRRADGEDIDDEELKPRLGDSLRRARRRPKPTEEDEGVDLADGTISKIDDEQRNVFGWAYVTHGTDGKVNIDKSGDFIDTVEEIEKSAYDYVLKSREGDDMHTNVKTSTMIESVVFTPEKIEKMGIAPGTVPLGWWIGFHIDDDNVWDRVKKGELRAFSIHGSGTRQKIDSDEVN